MILSGRNEECSEIQEVSFCLLEPDGKLELPAQIKIVCRKTTKLDEFEGFQLHYYPGALRQMEAADVRELLGHSKCRLPPWISMHTLQASENLQVLCEQQQIKLSLFPYGHLAKEQNMGSTYHSLSQAGSKPKEVKYISAN